MQKIQYVNQQQQDNEIAEGYLTAKQINTSSGLMPNHPAGGYSKDILQFGMIHRRTGDATRRHPHTTEKMHRVITIF